MEQPHLEVSAGVVLVRRVDSLQQLHVVHPDLRPRICLISAVRSHAAPDFTYLARAEIMSSHRYCLCRGHLQIDGVELPEGQGAERRPFVRAQQDRRVQQRRVAADQLVLGDLLAATKRQGAVRVLSVNCAAVQNSSASAAGTAACVSMFVGHMARLRRGFSDCLLQLLEEPLHFVIRLHVAGRNHL